MIKECVICSAPFQAMASTAKTCSQPCRVENNKRHMRDYAKKHSQELRQYKREWRAKNRGKERATRRAYAKKHSQELRQYKREWRAKNAERLRAFKREWVSKNPERVRQYGITRREKDCPPLKRLANAMRQRKKHAAQLLRLKAHMKKVGAK